MAMFKIYVGNLDYKVTAEILKPLFEPFGELNEITIAVDAEGKSRGFAIVLFKDKMKGQLAIETLAEKKVLGRSIIINEALKKGKKLKPELKKPEIRQGPFGPKFNPNGGRSFGGAGPRGATQPRLGGAGGSRPNSSRNPRRASGSASGGGLRSSQGNTSGGELGGAGSDSTRSFPSGNFQSPRPTRAPDDLGSKSPAPLDPKWRKDGENK